MTIEIISIKRIQSKKGGTFGIAEVKNESGAHFQDTTIFNSFPGYEGLLAGSKVEGNIEPNDYNGKKQWKLTEVKSVSAPAWATKGPSGAVAAAKTTAASVEKSQERKEEGIKVSSTMNKAIELAIAEIGAGGSNAVVALEERIEYWRRWIWTHWDASDKDFPPFN